MKTILKGFLIVGGVLAFVFSLWGGLYWQGWDLPFYGRKLAGIHGPLIICGFLGSLLILERCATVKRNELFFLPVLNALGSLALFIWPIALGPRYLILAASVGFVLASFLALFRGASLYNIMILGGSGLWLTGTIIWLAGWPVYNIYLWWIGAFLFTLVGQRLEVAIRLGLESSSLPWLTGGFVIVFIGLVLMTLGHLREPDYVVDVVNMSIKDPRLTLGIRVSGFGLMGTSAWLLKNDVAWSSLRNKGLSRYMAASLLSGYVWLGVSGVFSVIYAGLMSGFPYGALVHSFFVGYVFFMLYALTPGLLFSLLGVHIKNPGPLFVHIIFLHGALLIWTAASLAESLTGAKIGGLLTTACLLLFVGSIAWMSCRTVFRRPMGAQ